MLEEAVWINCVCLTGRSPGQYCTTLTDGHIVKGQFVPALVLFFVWIGVFGAVMRSDGGRDFDSGRIWAWRLRTGRLKWKGEGRKIKMDKSHKVYISNVSKEYETETSLFHPCHSSSCPTQQKQFR